MATPGGSAGTDVVATFQGTCTNVKLASTGSVKDSSTTDNAWNLKVPLTSCAIAATEGTDSTTNKKYVEYALYWNSQLSDNNPAQQLYQIGQVKMVCRVDPYQEDAVVVKVTEDTSIADPTAQRVDIATDLALEISHLSFIDANKQDITALIAAPTAVTNTAGGTLGNAGLTYTGNFSHSCLPFKLKIFRQPYNNFCQPLPPTDQSHSVIIWSSRSRILVLKTSSILIRKLLSSYIQ